MKNEYKDDHVQRSREEVLGQQVRPGENLLKLLERILDILATDKEWSTELFGDIIFTFWTPLQPVLARDSLNISFSFFSFSFSSSSLSLSSLLFFLPQLVAGYGFLKVFKRPNQKS